MKGQLTRLAVLAAAACLAGAAPAEAAGSVWTVIPSADPSPAFSTLAAVSALNTTSAWAVGTYTGPNRHDGKVMLAERWNGSTWSQVPTPNVQFFDEKLLAVSASSAGEAWAVGSVNQTSFATTNPLTAHWTGGAWSIVANQATTGTAKSILSGVADFGPSSAWAVGRSRSGSALIEHWDGAAWSIVASASNPVPPAGETLGGSTLTAISALSPTDIWAVGSYSTVSGTVSNSYTLTEHYDGTNWRVVPSPNTAVRHPLNGARQVLGGVVAISASDAWAVGNTIDTASGSFLPDKTLVLHWNGSSWAVVGSPDHPNAEDVLTAVAGSASDVWAVGQYVDRTPAIPVAHALTLHWNGSAWSSVASPNGADGDTILNGASRVPGTASFWAAGFNLAAAGGYRTFVLRTP